MEKEGGNRERMRKCRESISLHFLILSPFPLRFLFISSFSLHFLAAWLQGCNDSCSPDGASENPPLPISGTNYPPIATTRICSRQLLHEHRILLQLLLATQQITLKSAKLEFGNHKNQYFSWLLRSEHVKTNIFQKSHNKIDHLRLV